MRVGDAGSGPVPRTRKDGETSLGVPQGVHGTVHDRPWAVTVAGSSSRDLLPTEAVLCDVLRTDGRPGSLGIVISALAMGR